MEEIKPIAMPGTHQKFLKFFKEKMQPTSLKVLDMGAGHGAFTKRLYDMGYDVQACDLFPEIFNFDKIECRKADITQELPYPDNSFDLVIAIEVSEHILDHEKFFSETSRVLKPRGKFYISTPNILNMKSRARFFFSGFFYSFKPLEIRNYNGLQHVASITLDQYNYVAVKNGMKPATVDIDRKQKSSRWLLFFFYPAILLHQKFKKIGTIHNQRKLLLGRLLFLTFENDKSSQPRDISRGSGS